MVNMFHRKILFSASIIILFFASSLLIDTSACIGGCDSYPLQRIFNLDLMSIFNENDINNEISILIQKILPSIGIGVGIHEVTHWG
ncbi:MAG: hypothetical protein H7644_14690, partial [Candidatus Heimdallarchaeota archaeon]|nr:hypothetical protein [Candidatus Heimdallarchaeota archaeon]MCK5145010.1 hypothetical protein [Candidatus Heimdallarchaeota archaeon]